MVYLMRKTGVPKNSKDYKLLSEKEFNEWSNTAVAGDSGELLAEINGTHVNVKVDGIKTVFTFGMIEKAVNEEMPIKAIRDKILKKIKNLVNPYVFEQRICKSQRRVELVNEKKLDRVGKGGKEFRNQIARIHNCMATVVTDDPVKVYNETIELIQTAIHKYDTGEWDVDKYDKELGDGGEMKKIIEIKRVCEKCCSELKPLVVGDTFITETKWGNNLWKIIELLDPTSCYDLQLEEVNTGDAKPAHSKEFGHNEWYKPVNLERVLSKPAEYKYYVASNIEPTQPGKKENK